MDNQILLRDDLEDMGQTLLPQSYFWSPDIILHDRMEDPEGFLTWSYSHDVSQPMLPQGGSMLVYVRAKNRAQASMNIYVHLYDMGENNFTHPMEWKKLATEDSCRYATINQVPPQEIGVTKTPFVFNSLKGEYRTLVAIASYSTDDPRSEMKEIKDSADFAYWVREHPSVCIRVQDTVATLFTLASNDKCTFRFHPPVQVRNSTFRFTVSSAFPAGTLFTFRSPFFPEKKLTIIAGKEGFIEIEGNETSPGKYGNIEIEYSLPGGNKIKDKASISMVTGIKDAGVFYPLGRSTVKYLQGRPSTFGNTLTLDFRKQEDCSLFYNTCVSPEELSGYPYLQRFLAASRTMPTAEKPETAEVPLLAVNEEPELCNTVRSYVHKEDRAVVYTSLLNLEKTPVCAVVKIEVRDRATGRQIGVNVDTIDASRNMRIETCVPQQVAPEEVEVRTTLICVGKPTGNTSESNIQAVMVRNLLVGSDNIESYKIEAPVKKHETNKHICVSVENNDFCSSSESSDYKYNIAEYYRRSQEENRYVVPFFLPLKGYVKFDSKSILYPQTPEVSIRARSKEESKKIKVYYQNVDRNKMKWTFDGQKASWEFLDDWDCYIPIQYIRCSNILKLDISFGFHMGNGLYYVFIISDDNAGREGNHLLTEYIQWSWGCLAAGTRIRMADGSEKPVEDLRPGDCVCGKTHPSVRIADVQSQSCDKPILLKTTTGKQLLLTHVHPVNTERGICAAKDLTAADRVCTEHGTFEGITELVELEQLTRVFNPVTEQPDCIIANGILTGDGQEENRASQACKNSVESSPQTRELQEEMKRFGELLLNKSKEA